MWLEGEKVTLRAMEPSDADLIYKWENDTSLWNYSSAVVPYSKYDVRNYIDNSGDLFQTGQLRLMIDLKQSNETIGCIDFYDFQPRFSRGEVAFLIDSVHQGNGYATEALKLIREYLFNFLHIHQIYAYVVPSNILSLQVCQSTGFVRQATLTDWFRDESGWTDAILLTCVNK